MRCQGKTAKDSRVEITCAVRGDKPACFGVVITAHQIIQFQAFIIEISFVRKAEIVLRSVKPCDADLHRFADFISRLAEGGVGYFEHAAFFTVKTDDIAEYIFCDGIIGVFIVVGVFVIYFAGAYAFIVIQIVNFERRRALVQHIHMLGNQPVAVVEEITRLR